MMPDAVLAQKIVNANAERQRKEKARAKGPHRKEKGMLERLKKERENQVKVFEALKSICEGLDKDIATLHEKRTRAVEDAMKVAGSVDTLDRLIKEADVPKEEEKKDEVAAEAEGQK